MGAAHKAIIPIPTLNLNTLDVSAPISTLVLKCVSPASPNMSGNAQGGCVLDTNGSGTSDNLDLIYGAGPCTDPTGAGCTSGQSWFTAVHLVLDGWTIRTTKNNSIVLVNGCGMPELEFYGQLDTGSIASTAPTDGVGIISPCVNNFGGGNTVKYAGMISGFLDGLITGEHAFLNDLEAFSNANAIVENTTVGGNKEIRGHFLAWGNSTDLLIPAVNGFFQTTGAVNAVQPFDNLVAEFEDETGQAGYIGTTYNCDDSGYSSTANQGKLGIMGTVNWYDNPDVFGYGGGSAGYKLKLNGCSYVNWCSQQNSGGCTQGINPGNLIWYDGELVFDSETATDRRWTATQNGGRFTIQIPHNVTLPASDAGDKANGFVTGTLGTFTGQSVSACFSDTFLETDANDYAAFIIGTQPNASHSFTVEHYDNKLYFTTSGSGSANVTYNSVNDHCIRARESGGTIAIDVSPTGYPGTWTAWITSGTAGFTYTSGVFWSLSAGSVNLTGSPVTTPAGAIVEFSYINSNAGTT